MLGWTTKNKCVKDNGEDYCQNKRYSPQAILSHVMCKSSKCMYHHAIYYYLTTLYCNSYGKLRKSIPNGVVLPPLDQKYKDLMN